MKIKLIENQSKKQIGEQIIFTHPRNGEWVEFNQYLYSIHRVIHTKEGITLMVIRGSKIFDSDE